MTIYVTNGTVTFTPANVTGYESERTSGNIVHPILGRANPDVTIRPAQLRTGTLRMRFAAATAEPDSKACEDAHATGAVFSLVSSEYGTIAMSYVVAGDGRIRRTLDMQTKTVWILEIDYQEVTP